MQGIRKMSCPDEDILLFSSAYYSRYGDEAYAMALGRSAELAACQDYEGVAVWHRVAERLDRLAPVDKGGAGKGGLEPGPAAAYGG